jgi:hypothetical protein
MKPSIKRVIFGKKPYKKPIFQTRLNTLAFVDDSVNAIAISNNNVSLSTTNQKFGAGCASFNGIDSKLSLAVNSIFDFGVKPFTVCGWVSVNSTATVNNGFLWGTRAGDTAPTIGLSFFWQIDGSLRLQAYNTSNVDMPSLSTAAGVVPANNTYYFVEQSRDKDGLWRIFVDGDLKASVVATGILQYPAPYSFMFGRGAGGVANTPRVFNGYMDNLQVFDYVLHTSNYTPPTREPSI